MKRKLIPALRIGSFVVLSLLIAAAVILPASVLADAKDDVLQGVGTPPAGAPTSPQSVVETAIDLLSAAVAAIAVIMIIIGGFKYVMSGGDSNGTKSAQNTILYALAGLVVVAFAQILVRFVVSKV